MTHSFDEFSKLLAEESLPRRDSLRRLGAILTGAVLGSLAVGAETASAIDWPLPRRKLPTRKTVHTKQQKTGKLDPCATFCRCRNQKQQLKCLTACRSCNNDPSRLKGACGTYTCTDLSADPNCGSVGNNCGARGLTYCKGTCVDFKNDAANCGACGTACGSSTPYCINGTCSQCPPGLTRCGNACVNLSNDPANCGACGKVCGGSTPYCSGGTCTDCGPCGTLCGGQCIDIMWDSRNCGGCGAVCPDQTACAFGVCEGLCIGCG